jgi:hypothetical protein
MDRLIVLTEALDDDKRVVFLWNQRKILAGEAFTRLRTVAARIERHSRVRVVIHGKLGHDVVWEYAGTPSPVHAVRQLFHRWYTQAVQAQAALVRQRVVAPAFTGESRDGCG